jgi:hypothetical protein
MPDRRVLGVPLVRFYRLHYRLSGVHANSDLERQLVFAAQRFGVAFEVLLHPQGGIQGDSNCRSSLRPYIQGRLVTREMSTRPFQEKRHREVFSDTIHCTAPPKNERISNGLPGAKDPKGTGGSNPLCSSNESVRTAGPVRGWARLKRIDQGSRVIADRDRTGRCSAFHPESPPLYQRGAANRQRRVPLI